MGVEITLLVAMAVSIVTIRLAMPLAERVGLIDRPGGHKQHDTHVPLVGGVGIYVALVAVLGSVLVAESGVAPFFGSLLLGSGLLFVVGLLDDIEPMGVAVRFGAQAVAASVTALWGGFLLQDFGLLLGPWAFVLGFMALPVTLFATAGVINALNMADGVDGLSGSLSFVTLCLLAIVAFVANKPAYLITALALLGAVAGFLVFNLRCCGRKRAHIFMGDSGSTVLGFLFACLFIGLSQGGDRAMAPVIALWLFAVPLYDTTATMVRRVWLRKSPVRPDRSHLHHLLLDAGFTVSQGVALMATLQLVLGLIGIAGWYHGVAEYWMFAGFLGLFAVYLYLVSRPWRFVPAMRQLHRHVDARVDGATSVFVGGLSDSKPEQALRDVLQEHADTFGYSLYRHSAVAGGAETCYAVLDVGCERTARRLIRQIRERLTRGDGIIVRQLIPRQSRHDRRRASHPRESSRRRADRRDGKSELIAVYRPGSSSTSNGVEQWTGRSPVPAMDRVFAQNAQSQEQHG